MSTSQWMKDGSVLEEIQSIIYDLSESGMHVSVELGANGWCVHEDAIIHNMDSLEDVLEFVKGLNQAAQAEHGPIGS